MKIRNGFVSNSSSSSFVIISAGDITIVDDGDSDSFECCRSVSVDINDMISQLEKAKEQGATAVHISHGGGYDG